MEEIYYIENYISNVSIDSIKRLYEGQFILQNYSLKQKWELSMPAS